jgi:hypothetical protein
MSTAGISEEAVLRLDSGLGTSFEMQIAGYEISNFRPGHPREVLLCWPILWILARNEQEDWSADSSVGSTRELIRLGNWFRALGRNNSAKQFRGFSEPCLRFEWRQFSLSRRTMLVHIGGELGPNLDGRADRKEGLRTLEFNLDLHQLLRAGEAVREMLVKYPERPWNKRPVKTLEAP